MALSPHEIEGASFNVVKKGGLDPDEVRSFLRSLAHDVRAYDSKLQEAERVNDDLRNAGLDMAEVIREVHTSLGEKRRAADAEIAELKRRAELEAAALINSATEEAEGTRADVEAQRNELLMAERTDREAAARGLDDSRVQADQIVRDAQARAELLSRQGEEAIRQRCNDTVEAARAELRTMATQRSAIVGTLSGAREELDRISTSLRESAFDDHQLDDVYSQKLVDIRSRMDPAGEQAPPAVLDAVEVPSTGGDDGQEAM